MKGRTWNKADNYSSKLVHQTGFASPDSLRNHGCVLADPWIPSAFMLACPGGCANPTDSGRVSPAAVILAEAAGVQRQRMEAILERGGRDTKGRRLAGRPGWRCRQMADGWPDPGICQPFCWVGGGLGSRAIRRWWDRAWHPAEQEGGSLDPGRLEGSLAAQRLPLATSSSCRRPAAMHPGCGHRGGRC